MDERRWSHYEIKTIWLSKITNQHLFTRLKKIDYSNKLKIYLLTNNYKFGTLFVLLLVLDFLLWFSKHLACRSIQGFMEVRVHIQFSCHSFINNVINVNKLLTKLILFVTYLLTLYILSGYYILAIKSQESISPSITKCHLNQDKYNLKLRCLALLLFHRQSSSF